MEGSEATLDEWMDQGCRRMGGTKAKDTIAPGPAQQTSDASHLIHPSIFSQMDLCLTRGEEINGPLSSRYPKLPPSIQVKLLTVRCRPPPSSPSASTTTRPPPPARVWAMAVASPTRLPQGGKGAGSAMKER